MRYYIEGYYQEKLVKLGLNYIDALILRWFADFHPRMTKILNSDGEYRLVKYQRVIDDLPICGIDNRESIARRFTKLAKSGVLEKLVTKNTDGTITAFKLTAEYSDLLAPDYKVETSEHEAEAPDSKVDPHPTQKSSALSNNSSINNSIIKEKINKKEKIDSVIGYFNNVNNTNLSGSDEVVSGLTEILKSHTVDEIKLVVDFLADKKGWYYLNNRNTLSTLSRYTKFYEKLEMALNAKQKPKPPKIKTHRYENPEYLTPENEKEKRSLALYIMGCYRKKTDPRNLKSLTQEQWDLICRHAKRAKFEKMGFEIYIYQQEVLTYKSLLDQTLDDADVERRNSIVEQLKKVKPRIAA